MSNMPPTPNYIYDDYDGEASDKAYEDAREELVKQGIRGMREDLIDEVNLIIEGHGFDAVRDLVEAEEWLT